MTGCTRRYAFLRHAALEDRPSLCHQLRIATSAGCRLLRRVMRGERRDFLIAQLRGHSPHVGLSVGVGARLSPEGFELLVEVASRLCGEIGEHWRGAPSSRAVTGTTNGRRETLGGGLSLGAHL